MAADTLTREDIGRLCEAAHKARLVLRRPRENRTYLVRQYAGRNFSEEGTARIVPVNLIALYVSIVGRKLFANQPKVMISTADRTIRAAVSAMETWCNREIEALDIRTTLKRAVIDSLFSIGIVKVALGTPAEVATVGWDVQAGEPFVSLIDLDDFVVDPHCKDFSEAAFIGHRVRVPLRAALKMYGKNRDLTASDDRLYNMEGDERVSLIGRTTLAGEEELEDMVDLWEFYLPRHRLVVTLKDDDLTGASASKEHPSFGKALKIQNWVGPSCGPYHFLGMMPVPGNFMPKAPLHDLLDLHESINNGFRKLINQAQRQKQVGLTQGGADEDGRRIIETNDGELSKCDNPQSTIIVNYGGPDQQLFQFMSALRDLFSWLSGNLDIMGGLSPQSKTLGQDELLQENSSASVSEMQSNVLTFTSSVMKAMCWYWHHDPQKVMRVPFSVPGLPNVSTMRHVFPSGGGQGRQLMRGHKFEDMDIRVDPYSLQPSTPQQKMTTLVQMVTQIIAPMMPILQQQGIAFDVHEFLQKVAKLGDLPDLADILTIRQAPSADQPPSAAPQTSGSPAETTRNYVRRSVGGASQYGKEKGMGDMMTPPQQNGQMQGASR